jgi:hypothetical protein
MSRRKEHRGFGLNVGSASIVMVFAVLCLTVFAALSLVTASRELALADRTADAVTNYYTADSLAVEVYDALLENPDEPGEIRGVEIGTDSGSGTLCYAVPVDENQRLFIRLRREGEALRILEWILEPTGEWTPDDGLRVWDGNAA